MPSCLTRRTAMCGDASRSETGEGKFCSRPAAPPHLGGDLRLSTARRSQYQGHDDEGPCYFAHMTQSSGA